MIQLIENARNWHKFWSVRFDFIMYSVMGYFLANPHELDKLIDLLPDSIRPIVAFLVPMILFAAKTGSRITVQSKLTP